MEANSGEVRYINPRGTLTTTPGSTKHCANMKLFLSVLVAAVLCVEQACSLTCYTCTSQSSNSQCMTSSNCTSPENVYCETDVFNYLVGLSITKKCSASCAASSVTIAGVGITTTCCSTDLCNVSGATSVRISYLALAVTAGFICLLQRSRL
ncbi:lymphocyte antigen 6E-like [Ambystoma mexicanum]|uniref:lymphocyte antigen 6E-like n=1 Tax=Ambystoma mexicanum TaxID=8296 RepID=UPI0037E74694